jgi:hypothetical protein
MKRVLFLALAASLAVMPYATFAQGKPSFAGTWTLDAAKSDPAPAGRGGGGGGAGGGGGRGGGGGGAAGPQTITQTATDITIGPNTYKLDGSETTIEGRGGPQKAKAMWEGNNLVITTVVDFNGQSITTKATRSLSADGKEMTVTTETPQGSRKQVYTKS